jgi:hypothetical protein
MKENTVVALFDEFEDARGSLSDLVQAGIARDRIALLANGASSRHPSVLSNPAYAREDMEKPESDATSGLGLGVVIGAGILGILGYLIGSGTVAVPVLTALVAGMTWIAVAVGAVVGGVAGGVVGWMTDRGVSDEDEKLYAAGLQHNGTLVTVHVPEDFIDRATVIFKARGAVDIETRDAAWRADGWVSFDPDDLHGATATAGGRAA